MTSRANKEHIVLAEKGIDGDTPFVVGQSREWHGLGFVRTTHCTIAIGSILESLGCSPHTLAAVQDDIDASLCEKGDVS